MKNKKLLYLLIPGTLLVWGMILHKIFYTINGDDVNSFQNAPFISTADNEILNDTFSIHADYRDPFSGKVIKKVSILRIPVPKTIVPKVIVPWPVIVYGGIIKNQKSGKQSVLVEVNGHSNTMKTGEQVDGVELIKVFRDSIEVKFQKEKKYILK